MCTHALVIPCACLRVYRYACITSCARACVYVYVHVCVNHMQAAVTVFCVHAHVHSHRATWRRIEEQEAAKTGASIESSSQNPPHAYSDGDYTHGQNVGAHNGHTSAMSDVHPALGDDDEDPEADAVYVSMYVCMLVYLYVCVCWCIFYVCTYVLRGYVCDSVCMC